MCIVWHSVFTHFRWFFGYPQPGLFGVRSAVAKSSCTGGVSARSTSTKGAGIGDVGIEDTRIGDVGIEDAGIGDTRIGNTRIRDAGIGDTCAWGASVIGIYTRSAYFAGGPYVWGIYNRDTSAFVSDTCIEGTCIKNTSYTKDSFFAGGVYIKVAGTEGISTRSIFTGDAFFAWDAWLKIRVRANW